MFKRIAQILHDANCVTESSQHLRMQKKRAVKLHSQASPIRSTLSIFSPSFYLN